MKVTFWIIAAVAVSALSYSLAPDLVRYMKMRSM